MKGSLNETQPAASRGFSLRSMLLLVLLVGVGAGATAYVVGSAFAAANDTSTTGPSHCSCRARCSGGALLRRSGCTCIVSGCKRRANYVCCSACAYSDEKYEQKH